MVKIVYLFKIFYLKPEFPAVIPNNVIIKYFDVLEF